MGGKVKQRTKGNTKPSSSGRAAELMSRSGSTGFVGFGDVASTSDGSSLQFVPAGNDSDVLVHADFHVVMKKLTKRDALTRLKAVQEFGELCKTSTMEAVQGALPFWPRLYNKLALDVDYRVREAAQLAMNQMASRVGKNLAPHLKSVIGVWICSQCDSYTPVATAAQKSFSVVFSESKQVEVLEFCKREVVEFLQDNLINQTADTLSDPKIVEEEDRLAKYIRVISSSLLALAKFVKMVNEDVNTEMCKYYQAITEEKKFWKLGKHKSPQIRAAFFSLVSALCQKVPTVLENCQRSVCPIVLGSIDEADATVSSHLWEAVLQVVNTVQDCWQHVNIEKAVLPKFWNFLSNAAFGNANPVLINLLPFLSKLPLEVVSHSSGFYENVFRNLIEGLQRNRVQQSQSECRAVVLAFMDCTRYVLLPGTQSCKITMKEDELRRLRIFVIDQLITVVGMSLEPKSCISSTPLYGHLGNFLHDFSNDGEIGNYFWHTFDDLIYGKVNCSNTENKVAFQEIVRCLCSLKSPGTSLQKSKVGTKVRFQESSAKDNEGGVKNKHEVVKQKKSFDTDVGLIYGGKLLNSVGKVLHSCLEHVVKERSECHLVLLSDLVKEFCSPVLLKGLIRTSAAIGMQDDSEFDSVNLELSMHCINVLVLPLIANKSEHKTGRKDKWLSSLVQLLFVLMDEAEEDNQKLALETVLQVNSTSELLHLIMNEIFDSKLFLYLSCVHGLEIGKRVVELLKRSFSCYSQETSNIEDQGNIWRILDLVFKHSKLLEFFFDPDSLKDIFQLFHNTLSRDQVIRTDLISALQVIEKFTQNTEFPSTLVTRLPDILNDVVLDVVKLRLQGYQEQDCLSRYWHSVVSSASSDEEWMEKLVRQTTQVIKEHLYSSKSTTIGRFSVFVETSVEIIQSLNKGSNEQFQKTLQELSPTATEWDKLRLNTSSESLWAIAPLFDGELNFAEALQFPRVVDEVEVEAHHKTSLFLARAVKQMLPPGNDIADELAASEQEWMIRLALELLWMRECLQRIPSIHKGGTRDILLETLQTNLNPFLEWMAETNIELMLGALLDLSQLQGGLWSLTLKSVIVGCQTDQRTNTQLDTLITTCQTDHRQCAMHTLQVLLASDTSIYNLKVIVESYNKKWKSTEASDSLGNMFCLCLISCALERWIYLAKDSEIAGLECRSTLLDVLEDIRDRKDTLEALLLFSCSLDDVQMSTVSTNMAIIRIFKLAVSNYSMNISAEQWDMILCCMLDWLQSCQESHLGLVHVSAMANHVCQLIKAVARELCKESQSLENSTVAETSPEQVDARTSTADMEDKPLIEKLAEEWREFFSNTACGNLLRLMSTVAETDISSDPQLYVSFHRLSEALSDVCTYLSTENLKEYVTSKFKPAVATEIAGVSNWEEDFLQEFSPHLESTFSAFQIASYKLLLRVMPILASRAENKSQLSSKEDDPARPPPSKIMSVINSGQSKLLDVLSEARVPFGETLGMAGDVEALHISRAFLLAWKLLLSYFVSSSEELRVEYANYMRRGKYLNELLAILFRILPKKPSVGKRVFEGSRNTKEKCILDEEFVHCLAFETYYDLLQALPALVRQWWNNLDKKQATAVEKYTTNNVSPLLCEKEMQTVLRTSTTYDNMEVVTRSSTREVIAYYKIEEISIELIVGLSPSHPLGLITVNCGKRVGVKINQWRLWMMQLTTFLMHQNGTVIEGLMLWKRNVDKKFEGVDDCMICFSVIHGSNYSLPKLSCKTCKKKFHSACLYRWFSTSNNSTCPLCRNLF